MNLLIFGATSAIAQAVARQAVANEARVFLVGREAAKLTVLAADLKTRSGQKAGFACADFLAEQSVQAALQAAAKFMGRLDVVLIAHGMLPDQKMCEENWPLGEENFKVNLLSPAMIAAMSAQFLAQQGGGSLVVIGSVAGDRGRKGIYYYGAAKGGLERFVQGLRGRMYGTGVRVVLVKPGMVDTPMTAHLRKGPLFARPETIARCILRRATSGGETVYAPSIWWFIMAIIRSIPESIFKKLSI
jgi:short-subunit dehydrogenase